MQMHLEFFVDDLDATRTRVLAAGATRFEHQPNADHCFVYADPAGHPFCLSTWGAPRVAPPAESLTEASVAAQQ
jgi:hypothetical protein